MKKLIAKEFLLFIFVISTGLASYGLILANNYYYEYNIIKLTDEYYELRKPYLSKLEKQSWFTQKCIEKYKSNFNENSLERYVQIYGVRDDIWKILFRYSTGEKMYFKMNIFENNESPNWEIDLILLFKELGFETPDKINKFINDSRISKKDAEDFNKSKIISDELNTSRLKLFEEEEEGEDGEVVNKISELSFKITKLAFLVLFLLRYLFLGIKWSYLTIREK